MRNFIFSAIFISIATLSQAQTSLHEENRSMSKGSFNSLVLDLPNAAPKKVEQSWKTFIKDYKGKTKFDRKNSEFFTDDATIAAMSDNTVDVYAKVSGQNSTGSQLSVWYNLGVNYLSTSEYPSQYPAAEKMLQDFAETLSLDMLKTELKDQEKKLKDLEAQQKEMEKEKAAYKAEVAKNQASIADIQKKIAEGEANIAKKITEQAAKTGEIDAQKSIIENTKARLESAKR